MKYIHHAHARIQPEEERICEVLPPGSHVRLHVDTSGGAYIARANEFAIDGFMRLRFIPPSSRSSPRSNGRSTRALWRRSMEASTARLRSIILPINVQSYHWYIAILDVGPTQCCMEICTDVNIRNPAAEQTLTEIGN